MIEKIIILLLLYLIKTHSCVFCETANIFHALPHIVSNENGFIFLNNHSNDNIYKDLAPSQGKIDIKTCKRVNETHFEESDIPLLIEYVKKKQILCDLDSITQTDKCLVFQRDKDRKLLHNLPCDTLKYSNNLKLCSLLKHLRKYKTVYSVHGFQILFPIISNSTVIEIIWANYRHGQYPWLAKNLNVNFQTKFGASLSTKENLNDDKCISNYECRVRSRKEPILYLN
jgi:hypothetical protein